MQIDLADLRHLGVIDGESIPSTWRFAKIAAFRGHGLPATASRPASRQIRANDDAVWSLKWA